MQLNAAGRAPLAGLRREVFAGSKALQQLARVDRAQSSHVRLRESSPRCRTALALDTAASTSAPPEDKWVARTLTQFQASEVPASMQGLRDASWEALATLRMPSMRNEEYRYTDLGPLLKSSLQPAPQSAAVSPQLLSSHIFPEAATSVVVVVDGELRPELSRLEGLPSGVYVGGLQGAPAEALRLVGSQSGPRGGPFSVVNGAAASDAVVITVPQDVEIKQPLYILHLASGGSAQARVLNTPRLVLHAGAGSSVRLIEEYASLAGSAGSGPAFTCSVAELALGEGARVQHGYVQREASDTVHFKSTLVAQARTSEYTLTEVSLGGLLTRHDLGIKQEGEETNTVLRHFLLCGAQQLHDLHSKVDLNYPRGVADQLHKCIVSHSDGRGVFDGNVHVRQRAQKTDAQQLSRSLLLAPRATVNIKPNLQIVADDVKCTHGAAISDLAAEELFYFRARGINAAAARRALVMSFGAEVVQYLQFPQLVQRVQADITSGLQRVDLAEEAAARN